MISHLAGGAAITVDKLGLDPHLLWSEVQRHGATFMTIVGDAFARPLLNALEEASLKQTPYNLSSLGLIISSGVMWSQEVKDGLLAQHEMTLIDAIGSSEGGMGSSVSTRETSSNTAKFEQHALHYDSAQVEEIKTAMCAFLFFRYWQHLPEWNTRDQGPLQIKIDLAFEASELICATQRALGDYSEESSQQAISALLEDIKTIQNVFGTNDKTQMRYK